VTMRRTIRHAFTLIELVVVIAITSVLLLIIAIPLVQGFNLTRASQAYAEAQAAARAVRDMIVADLGSAAGVYFNPGPAGGLNLDLPAGTFNFTGVKLDMVLPAEGDPLRGPSNAFINPRTGMEDPTLSAPKGQPTLPAAPGMSMVRYWIGLRSPLADTDGNGEPNNNPYNDPYSDILMASNTQQDNLFVLYRAEVQPLVFDPGAGQYVVNTDYFSDINGDGQPDMDDPDFFHLTPAEFTGANLNALGFQKVRQINNWRKTGTVVTQLSRYDMLQAKFNARTGGLYGDIRDGIVPLVRFQPQVVSDESVKGERAVRLGDESDNPGKIGPDVYRTEKGQWSGATVKMFSSLWVDGTGPVGLSAGGGPRPPSGSSLPQIQLVPDANGGDGFSYLDVGTGVLAANFDAGLYARLREVGSPYPYTQAVESADARNVTLGNSGIRYTSAFLDNFVPFWVDTSVGEVFASFDIREVGNDVSGLFSSFQNRVPSDGADPGVDTGPADTPNSDPNILALGSPWNAADTFRTINNRFNNLWVRWNDFAPGLDRARYAKRYINLGQIAQPGGVLSPLSRLDAQARAYVVPGSEAIFGPDQRPGPTYGSLIRYTRVAARPVGPNQYFINYTDQPEPDWSAVFGVSPSYSVKVFDPNNFVSAVLQPQYRAGYVELNSRFGEPLPNGNIYASFRFQLTEPNDRVVVDYNTGDTVEVVLTIKNFPQSNIPFAQSVTVKGSTKVRNFFR